jgi:hypothetical protein
MLFAFCSIKYPSVLTCVSNGNQTEQAKACPDELVFPMNTFLIGLPMAHLLKDFIVKCIYRLL